MEYPISEILDRYSIALLKKERLQIDNDQELSDLSAEIDNYRKINTVVDEYIINLKEINGKIWDLEFDIRKGKEGELGLEEVGRRALLIRENNKIRVGYKNDIVEIFNVGYKDIKMNHVSSNG
jgi:uncharacterized protein YxjI